MFLYIDETGQTGANFLDAQQPHFICAALVTKEHFDEQYAQPWRAFLQRHGLAELHGNVAGPRAIEALAQDLVGLLTQADARFCVSRVEKRFALATNVFQALFDPAENQACHPMFIEEPMLRRRIVVQMGYALTNDVGEAFCESLFVQSNSRKVNEAFVTACDRLLDRIALIPDELARLSIREVTNWARDNPASFTLGIDDRKTGDGRHPNLIGFNNLVHCAQRIHGLWTPAAWRIVHDQQEQYQKAITYWQSLWSRAAPGEHVLPSGETRVYRALPNAEILFANSAESPGLQAVDTCLWVVGRGFQQKRLDDNAVRLLEYVLTRAELSDYSFEALAQ